MLTYRMISPEEADELRRRYTIDPQEGVLRRRRDGRPLSEKDAEGYIMVSFCGRRLKAHRVAWLLYTGRWPRMEIDHVNHRRDDNRRANLREVTHQQNCANRTPRANPVTGYVGISCVSRRYGTTFQFWYNMKRYTFLTLGEAALMRRRLGLRLFPDDELGF